MRTDTDNRTALGKWLCFLCVALGAFMDFTDSTMMNIALPAIARYFQVSVSAIEVVTTSYLLMISVLVIAFGRLSDMYGRKKLYILGFVTFTVAAAMCGSASAIWMLVVFRCIQGIGAALLIANGVAVLTDNFPERERGKAFGAYGSVIGISVIVGPVLGGLLTDNVGWRAVFFVHVATGITGLLLALKFIPSDPAREQKDRFDTGGTITFIASLSCFLILINVLSKPDRKLSVVVVLLIATLLLGVSFVAIESRVKDPLLDLSLFRRRTFSAASSSAYLVQVAMAVVAFLLPFYLDRVLHLSPTNSGYILAPIALFLVLTSPIGGYLSDRFGPRTISTIGALTNCIGFLALSTLDANTSPLGVVLRLIPIGVGGGLFIPANDGAIMGAVPDNRFGIASGMIGALRNFGSMSGIAVTSLIFASVHSSRLQQLGGADMPAEVAERQAFASSVQVIFLLGAAICAVTVITSIIRDTGRAGKRQEGAVATNP
jgi:EmrB/QacA subfamily drug resistance transporter